MVPIVVYGGAEVAVTTVETPQGVCDTVSQGKQSFSDGKILRMGHYAKILPARFRFVSGVS